jgi:hypothetical protein
MRVKISYTAQLSDILSECAYLLGNKGDTLKGVIDLFNSLQAALRASDVNTQKVFESIDSLRQGLAEVDVRLMEIGEIVEGHDTYHRDLRAPGQGESSPSPPLPPDDFNEENAEVLSD